MAVGCPQCVPRKSSAYSLSHHVRWCSTRNSSKGVHVNMGQQVIEQGCAEPPRSFRGRLCVEIAQCFLLELLLFLLPECSFRRALRRVGGIEKRSTQIVGGILRELVDDGAAVRVAEAQKGCNRNPYERPREEAVSGGPKGDTESLIRQDPVLLRDCAGRPAADMRLPNDPSEATREPSPVSPKPGKKAHRPRGKSTCERLRELHKSDPEFVETASLKNIGKRIDRKKGSFHGSPYYQNKLKPIRDELEARKKKVKNPQKWHDCSGIDDRGRFHSRESPEHD